TNLFKMRVFPIFGRNTKRILLDYTVPLHQDADGAATFRLPLMSDLEPVGDFRLTGTIRGRTLADSVRSATHPALEISPRDGDAQKFKFQQEQYKPDADFAIRFRQALDDGDKVDVRSYRPQGAGDDNEQSSYLLATLPP